jgi:hypothetical protein
VGLLAAHEIGVQSDGGGWQTGLITGFNTSRWGLC